MRGRAAPPHPGIYRVSPRNSEKRKDMFAYCLRYKEWPEWWLHASLLITTEKNKEALFVIGETRKSTDWITVTWSAIFSFRFNDGYHSQNDSIEGTCGKRVSRNAWCKEHLKHVTRAVKNSLEHKLNQRTGKFCPLYVERAGKWHLPCDLWQ